jgi:FeS assembly SUF system regulator
MRLSSLADYAVVILSAAARHCGAHGRLNATLLAEETGVPLPTVQKLVSRLSGAGLIETVRGQGGGVRLARPPVAISLLDVIEAVEGPIAMTSCVEHGAHDCCIEENCRVKPHWTVVNGAVREALAGVSLASLSSFPRDRAHQKVVLSGDAESGGPVPQAVPTKTLDSRFRGNTVDGVRA